MNIKKFVFNLFVKFINSIFFSFSEKVLDKFFSKGQSNVNYVKAKKSPISNVCNCNFMRNN